MVKIKDIVDMKGLYSAHDVGEKEISIDVEKAAITCYMAIGGTLEDWKRESKPIHEEYRAYGKAIAKADIIKTVKS